MAETKIAKDDLIRIKNEARMSKRLNENGLSGQMREAVERYTGHHIPKEISDDWTIVLNEVYPIVQFNLPSIFFRTPRVFLKPRNKFFVARRRNPLSGQMEQVQLDSQKSARTQEALINYALQEISYKNEVRKVLLDALLFKYGVMWHGYKGDFGMTEEQSMTVKNDMVFVQRLNPMRFIKDPAVPISQIDEARWVGRSFEIPLLDLLEDETLDVDKKQIKGKLGFGQQVRIDDIQASLKKNATDFVNTQSHRGHVKHESLINFTDPDFKSSPGARFITIDEIFIRPSKKERRNGEKGKILLLTDEQTKPLRTNPWPYKAEGWPAKILQFNEVPDHPFGLADIETYGSIADHKNLVINQQIRNAEQTNKIWVGISKEGANEEDYEKAREGQNTIVGFESGDVRQRMFVASGGGQASQELYLLDGRIERNLQDKSGVSDLKKGFLQSGEESATSVKLRAAGSSARPAYRQDIMSDFLRGSTHFITQLLKQFMPIKDVVRILGTTDVEWSDNFTKEEIQADVDVEIDVISMLPERPEDELQNLLRILTLMTDALQSPDIRAKILQEGKTFNLTPLVEQILNRLRLKDPEIFRGIRPEEGEGFASIRELRAAQENIGAALAGQQLPSPPQPGQDHRTRIEVYNSVAQLLQATQQVELAQVLAALIQQQTAILQEEEAKNNPRSGQRLRSRSNGVRPAAVQGAVQQV